jgi:hypothetical protein
MLFSGSGCGRTKRSSLSSVCAVFFVSNDLFAHGNPGIDNSSSFKDKMQTQIAPLITSTAQLISPQFDSPYAINLAFSATGLSALGVTGDLREPSFSAGQFADAENLVSTPSSNGIWTNAAPGRPGDGQLGRGVQGHKHQWCLPRR